LPERRSSRRFCRLSRRSSRRLWRPSRRSCRRSRRPSRRFCRRSDPTVSASATETNHIAAGATTTAAAIPQSENSLRRVIIRDSACLLIRTSLYC
jgi:hypothetical protein